MNGFGNSGVEVSVLGQGTWEMGDRAADGKREVEALREGLDLGMVHRGVSRGQSKDDVQRSFWRAKSFPPMVPGATPSGPVNPA
jgi:hypothetical protein